MIKKIQSLLIGLKYLALLLLCEQAWAQSNEAQLQSNWQNAILYAKTDPDKSLVYAQKAETFALTTSDLPMQAQIATLIGNIYGLNQNRPDKAAEYHRHAFEIYKNLFDQKSLKGKVLYDFFLENVSPIYQLISEENYHRRRRDKLAIRKYQELYTELSHFFLENEVKLAKEAPQEAQRVSFEAKKENIKNERKSVDNEAEILSEDIKNYRALSQEQKKLYDDYITQLEQKLAQQGVDVKDLKAQFIKENNRIRSRVNQLNLTLMQKDSLRYQDSLLAQQKLRLIAIEQRLKENKHEVDTAIYRRNLLIFALLGIISAIAAFLFYRYARTIQKQKNQISEQNQELAQRNEEIQAQKEHILQTTAQLEESYHKITDNIHYTQTIQQAILPHSSVLEKAFQEHFVLFLPKDIVSGDFYWFHQSANAQFVAVVDCTGHGVSGGFMSMLGYMLLNRIITENGNHDLAGILQEMDLAIQDILQQNVTNNTDGMAISLCKIEALANTQKRIQFVGSKQSLWYAQLADNQLIELKGDRYFIGGDYRQNHLFSVQEFYLKTGDLLYLTTDGLIDQNNPARKKFTRNRLHKLLDEVKDKDLATQKKIIHLHLNQHQAGSEQRDDITIWGLKL
ncbi:MAG: SpoIIE family protein phosphatase [Microscillaceae bacterium]|jgi:serine phosphatase RsbU (regulator of sigma subunit)|nr:SpoIIE family protein phosphatase [Microscillaceae bacterium]